MRRALILGITSLLWLGAGAGCGSDPSRPAQDGATIPRGLTAEQLYTSVGRAMAGHNTDVLHAVIVVEEVTLNSGTPVSIQGDSAHYRPEDYARRIWMHAATDSVRSEYRTRSNGESSDRVDRYIQRAGTRFGVDYRGNSGKYAASTCTGSDSTVVAVLLNCSQQGSTVSVEPGEYEGRPAILLTARGESKSDGATDYSKHTTFIDPTTYLPL